MKNAKRLCAEVQANLYVALGQPYIELQNQNPKPATLNPEP